MELERETMNTTTRSALPRSRAGVGTYLLHRAMPHLPRGSVSPGSASPGPAPT